MSLMSHLRGKDLVQKIESLEAVQGVEGKIKAFKKFICRSYNSKRNDRI
jgi:hypothetical protein